MRHLHWLLHEARTTLLSATNCKRCEIAGSAAAAAWENFPIHLGHISLDRTCHACSNWTARRLRDDFGLKRRGTGSGSSMDAISGTESAIRGTGDSGARRPAAMDDLHRPFRVRRRPAVAIRADPPDGRFRPDLYFEHHRAFSTSSRRGHCFWRMRAIAREGEVARRCRAILSAPHGAAALDRDARRAAAGAGDGSHPQPGDEGRNASAPVASTRPCCCASLADRLRGSNGFGAFVSDTLMKLGLLGTIIGFIIMLAPIARLDAADKVAMKSSMGLMSDGMAVAMYTTLGGPGRLDPDPDPVLHARRRDPAGVFRRRHADRDARHPGPGARP